MDVHLRELRYFVAVAEELHFSRAAERLFVSQPALSKQVRALERQLGLALFDRRARTVALTPAGAELLPRARDLLAGWDAAVRAARGAGAAVSLTVGLQTAVGRDLQRSVLQSFRERGWRITLRLSGWDDPTAGLATGATDVAFLWLPVASGDLAVRVLARERRWVATAAAHPMAARPEVDFADLRDEPFVALPGTAGPLRDFWLAVPQRAGREPVVGVEAVAADEALEAVAAGLGVVLLAEGNARLYPRPDVAYRPVRGLPPAELALAWRADDHRPEVAEFVAAFPAADPATGG
ncbi:LysR family transcriptional regulator [Micromonospora siamensis]|uniref:DNA-binding transcriptional regulator, LysR family n=1 Tax=Micromonospora siamensis TaxID=299152 RepID=A0A1C5IJT5_9ACTN|nr:LysR substrate-binding domain-containing protein [Micromonospora siamensis]SCG58525.1 DNA-binding transcriptional regulator, LysR family [Micromonospora siamensis]